MKYIRTYETEEGFLADKDSTSREFRLKPTLYKYSEAGDHILLENDDPRKHGDSTYMEITLDSDVEFSFYISNAPGDTQTIRDCKVDWGDGDNGSTRLTAEYNRFKLSHNYKAGSYSIELYAIGDYSMGDDRGYTSSISHPSSVKRVILGSDVVSIMDFAFYECSSLTSVYIPESVVSIKNGTFYRCSSLTSISIPGSVTSIESEVFFECSSLTSVYIPESVTSIGHSAFNTCSSLTSISIPGSVTSIDEYAFSGCSLTYIFSLNTTAPTLEYDRYYYELPTNGTLYIKPGATGYDAWLSKLPSGWKIVESL